MDCHGIQLDFARKTHIMGILNTTPDSFYDGGLYDKPERAIDHALKMVDDGADMIDIGGESSRPGAEAISVNEELKRTIPVLKKIRQKSNVAISIDTYKAEVAKAALDEGANIINDISGMRFDPKMVELVAQVGVPIVLMHLKGMPKTMQDNPYYEDLIAEIYEYLNERIEFAIQHGIEQSKIIIDPGIGFGKRIEDNFEILRNLRTFKQLGCPILIGPSRKSFIGAALNLPPAERKEGTAAAIAVGIVNGADIIRVHDVKEMAQVAKITDLLLTKRSFR